MKTYIYAKNEVQSDEARAKHPYFFFSYSRYNNNIRVINIKVINIVCRILKIALVNKAFKLNIQSNLKYLKHFIIIYVMYNKV